MVLAAIETLLSQKIGIDPSIIGSRKIARATEIRSSACGSPDLNTYFKVLQTSPQEFEELVEQIVVPETWFFRDRKSFDFLTNWVRSEWLPKSTRTELRLLSVPCSSGEEPYSIAIALMEAGLPTNRFSIDAIDISFQAIAKAQRAIYGKNSFRGEAYIDRSRYFQPTPEGYEVLPSVRSRVNFRQGNLLNAFSATQVKYDIIFCRNLLIYLEPSACTQVLNILERLLLNSGLLFVGAAETGKINGDRFTSVRQSFTFAYRKVEVMQSQPPKADSAFPSEKPPRQLNHRRQQLTERLSSPANKAPADVSTNSSFQPTLSSESTDSVPDAAASKLSLEMARKLADAGQVEVAINHCEQYLNRDRTSAEAYALLGTLYQAKTENVRAERYFQKALYLNPNCYEALIHLALLKEHRGDLVGASLLQQRIQKRQQIFQSAR